MARRATLRASDADRERIAERLRHATAEGRLLAEELEERLERTFAARTYGELDAVVSDLPGSTSPVHRHDRRQTVPWLRPVPMILMLIFIAPVLFSVLLAAAVVMATLFSTWLVFVFVAWWLFGHRMRYRGPYPRPLHAYRRWPASRPGGPRPRPWV
jgi:DUF1707 SHOCT-like domain